MSIFRLNHAVLYVGNVAQSVAFYRDVLGFEVLPVAARGARVAFLRAPGSTNDHDLGLFEVGDQAAPSLAGQGGVGLYHLAWEVDTLGDLEELAARLTQAGALVGSSDHGTTKSLYGKDPSGLEFEVVWLIPADRLTDADREARATIKPLFMDRELARFGRETAGGLGISRLPA